MAENGLRPAFDPMSDAMGVGDDERGPGIGLGFAKRGERLLRVGAHRNSGHKNIPVGDGLEGKVLLAAVLARIGEFGDRAQWRGL